ncbi:hypothetical protein PanWU01x14_065540 [Parasponia andersonii]|uniref:Uncharacterized protein n=1 Tax=Parasponia andersonii TaxID=3476 RepID=A0A2P5DGU7_PARAD|nr:hypothetical protein PanWU01x14_065540 [Parasponia andersonii]
MIKSSPELFQPNLVVEPWLQETFLAVGRRGEVEQPTSFVRRWGGRRGGTSATGRDGVTAAAIDRGEE